MLNGMPGGKNRTLAASFGGSITGISKATQRIFATAAKGQQQSVGSLSLDGMLSSAYQPFILSQGDGRLPATSGRPIRYRPGPFRPGTAAVTC
jgi:hypothetical protein